MLTIKSILKTTVQMRAFGEGAHYFDERHVPRGDFLKSHPNKKEQVPEVKVEKEDESK